jgi:hypothetical protein
MSNGLKVSWEVGERKPIGSTDKKGAFVARTGKNKGPVFQQTVVKVLSPK